MFEGETDQRPKATENLSVDSRVSGEAGQVKKKCPVIKLASMLLKIMTLKVLDRAKTLWSTGCSKQSQDDVSALRDR